MGVAIPLESMASINPIPPVNPVGADLGVCPDLEGQSIFFADNAHDPRAPVQYG
jgi:hypothetical protein